MTRDAPAPATPLADAVAGALGWLRHERSRLVVGGTREARARFFDAIAPLLRDTDFGVRRLSDRSVEDGVATSIVTSAAEIGSVDWFAEIPTRATILDVGFELPEPLPSARLHRLFMGVEAATPDDALARALAIQGFTRDFWLQQVVAMVELPVVEGAESAAGAPPALVRYYRIEKDALVPLPLPIAPVDDAGPKPKRRAKDAEKATKAPAKKRAPKTRTPS